MKITTIIASFLMIFLLFSCKKEDGNNDNILPEKGAYLRMKVNGQLVEHSNGEAFVDKSVDQLVVNFFSANNTSTGQLNMVIDPGTAISTIAYNPLEGDLGTMTYMKGAGFTNIYGVSIGDDGSSGTVTVTELKDINGNIQAAKGTFSGVFVNADGESVNITEGEFRDGRF